MEELKEWQFRKIWEFLIKSKNDFDNSIINNLTDDIKEFYLFNYSQLFYVSFCWLKKLDSNNYFKSELNIIEKSKFKIISNNIKHADLIFSR